MHKIFGSVLSSWHKRMKHKLKHCAFIPSVVLTLVLSMISLIQKSLSFSTHSIFSLFLCPCPTAERSPWFTAVSGTREAKAPHFSWLCHLQGWEVWISEPEQCYRHTPELNLQGIPKGSVPSCLNI